MKNLFDIIKATYLSTLTILVFINTCILAYLVPIVGFHIMPDNQAAAEMWKTVTLVMQGCITVIIGCIIVYMAIRIVRK